MAIPAAGSVMRAVVVGGLAAMAMSILSAAQPGATSPRFSGGAAPTMNPQALDGGEVVVEAMVDASGAVQSVRKIRETPPFGDAMAGAVRGWRFEPATATVKGGTTRVAAPVLVVGAFTAPATYGGASAPAQSRNVPSPRLPVADTITAPAYPPNGVGTVVVLVEIELTGSASVRGVKVVSPQSGFDGAALDAVRAWRFSPPPETPAADTIFVYGAVGFRAPVTRPVH